jgi:hypothetical protein
VSFGTLRRVLALAVMLVAGFVAVDVTLAAGQTAEAFVNGIYAHYKGDPAKAHGVYLDKESELRKYFEPSLVDLMLKDDENAKKNDEVPALDGDPFVDSQEWKITSFDIKIEHQGDDKATATVKFKNYGKPVLLHLNLVRLKDGWKIADIVWNGDEGTLRGLYTK